MHIVNQRTRRAALDPNQTNPPKRVSQRQSDTKTDGSQVPPTKQEKPWLRACVPISTPTSTPVGQLLVRWRGIRAGAPQQTLRSIFLLFPGSTQPTFNVQTCPTHGKWFPYASLRSETEPRLRLQRVRAPLLRNSTRFDM